MGLLKFIRDLFPGQYTEPLILVEGHDLRGRHIKMGVLNDRYFVSRDEDVIECENEIAARKEYEMRIGDANMNL
jgi:hypothetical protein